MDELSNLLENAPQEDELKAPQEITEALIESVADDGLQFMVERCDDPVVHKLALLKIAQNMVLWHSKVGEAANERGDEDCGTAWLRDAGKWQAIMDIVTSINIGPNDHWVNQG